MRSIKRGALVALSFAVLSIGTNTARGRLIETWEHKIVADTPSGWVGAIDWRNSRGGYSSRIFFGPVEVVLPGRASITIWILPLFLVFAAILFISAWRREPKSVLFRALTFAFIGLACGILTAYFGTSYLGTFDNWNFLSTFSGAPFSLIDSSPYWLGFFNHIVVLPGEHMGGCITWILFGVLLALCDKRLPRLMLICLLVVSYCTGIAAVLQVWLGFMRDPSSQWKWHLRHLSVTWAAIWCVLYISAHAYMIRLLRRRTQRSIT